MKYASFAATAVLAVGIIWAAHAAPAISAADLRQNLYASCFVNEAEGWAAGDLGRIFHTVDGGKTWEIQDAGTKRPFISISCTDASHLWMSGQAGQIAHSSNGGKTWQMQKSGTERQLLEISFVNQRRGLAVGDFGVLVRTDDGGATWTKIPLPRDTKLPPDIAEVVDPGDIVLYSIAFADPEHVWVVGEFGVILASTDGGLTWHAQDSPSDLTLFGVFFADRQRGWAVGLEASLLATTDGGISWEKKAVPTPPGFALSLYDVAIRGSYGWAVGNSGFLLSSADAGATWQLVKQPPQMGSYWFRNISLLPSGRGFIVGSTGLVLATERDTYKPLRERL